MMNVATATPPFPSMLASTGSFGKAMARPRPRHGRWQRRPGRVAGVTGVAVGLAVALAACASAPPSSSAAAGGSRPASPSGMSCAWPAQFSAQTDNIAFPDAAEAYFLQQIVASAGTRIVLSGRFPDARYASVQVYTPGGAGTSLPDYRIAPQPGSQNPWQQQAAPGGRFTVTIGPDPAPGQANTLPLAAGTTSQHPDYLMYRVYLPTGGGGLSAVPVPVLTVEQGGSSRTLPACSSHNAPVHPPAVSGSAASAGAGGSGAAAPPPRQLEFFKPPPSSFNNGGLANADTSYVLAYLVRPPAADVVVVTAKAPTFAPGSHPSPWPARGEDVRYWSICIGLLAPPTPVVANKLPGGRDRLRVPRRRGHQAERGRRLHLRDRQRIAAGCHQPRPRRHLPALLHHPPGWPVPPEPAERAGQHVVRALAPGRHAGQRPGGGRGRHGFLLPAHGGLPAGVPHRQRPAGMPAVSRAAGTRCIISIEDRTDATQGAIVRTCGQA